MPAFTQEDLSNLQKLRVMLQPLRWKIITQLRTAEQPIYVRELAERLEADQRLVRSHFMELKRHGLVEGEYGEVNYGSGSGRPGRYYKLTPEVYRVFNWFVSSPLFG